MSSDPLFTGLGLDRQSSAELLKLFEEGGELDGFLDMDGNLDASLLGEAINNGQLELGKLLSMKSIDFKNFENDVPGLTREVSMYINKIHKNESAFPELAEVPSLLGTRNFVPPTDEDDDPGLPYAADYRPSKSKSPHTASLERGLPSAALNIPVGLEADRTGPAAGRGRGAGGRGRRGAAAAAQAQQPATTNTTNTTNNGTDTSDKAAGGRKIARARRGGAAVAAPVGEASGSEPGTDHGVTTGDEDEQAGAGAGANKRGGGRGGGRGGAGGRSKKRKEPMSADDRAMKKLIRMEKNRESAARSRAKKQEQLEELEKQVQALREEKQALEARANQPQKPADIIVTRGLRKTRTLPVDFKL